jgi:DNA-binding beta-propeller fold protein YncE
MAVTNNGQSTQSLQLIDIVNEKILDSVNIPTSWLGLKFNANEKYLYVSGGNENRILKYSVIQNKLHLADSILLGKPWPNKISPTGLEIDNNLNKMYVVTKDNNTLYIINLVTKKIINEIKLPAEAYTCLLSPNKKELYISCWGCEQLLIFNTVTSVITAKIPPAPVG